VADVVNSCNIYSTSFGCKASPRSCPTSPVPLTTEALFKHDTIFMTHIFLGTPLSDTVGDRKSENAVHIVRNHKFVLRHLACFIARPLLLSSNQMAGHPSHSWSAFNPVTGAKLEAPTCVRCGALKGSAEGVTLCTLPATGNDVPLRVRLVHIILILLHFNRPIVWAFSSAFIFSGGSCGWPCW
jgi:hypothetical protein